MQQETRNCILILLDFSFPTPHKILSSLSKCPPLRELKHLSPLQRLKGLFFNSGVEDPLSNVSAGAGLQATAESAGRIAGRSRLIDPFDFEPAHTSHSGPI